MCIYLESPRSQGDRWPRSRDHDRNRSRCILFRPDRALLAERGLHLAARSQKLPDRDRNPDRVRECPIAYWPDRRSARSQPDRTRTGAHQHTKTLVKTDARATGHSKYLTEIDTLSGKHVNCKSDHYFFYVLVPSAPLGTSQNLSKPL